MQTKEGRSNGISQSVSDYLISERAIDSSMMTSSNLLLAPSSGVNHIEHRVSKMDTLAGVAIKYGVEVADIKRLNGLVTDLQMFAHKTLLIPLPGRHPPSPILSNGSASPGESSNGHTKTRRPHIDLLDSLQSLKLKYPQRTVSPAMCSLQGYYGLTPSSNRGAPDGTEMAVYKTHTGFYPEDELQPKTSTTSAQPPGHRKSRSIVNGHLLENGEMAGDVQFAEAGDSDADRSNDKAVRRRQKADVDPTTRTPELLLKEDSSGGFSGITGKRLALRPKSASRTSLAADAESGRPSPIPLGDSLVANGHASVRKSSSTSSLQDSSENSSSIWPTAKWNLKPDLQALSAAAIARPIFDGFSKPITSWINKAARD
ncbi:uncharacterized protein LOC131236842 [Magnolia sinica]|uniref:uncharacterized protein LOC131236842 n=1 Tax=Magnolia sinica TaxID=86752 RepID=UPI0026592460|nr:uncharacterized protein LOC131236842 [Magnolia sinica]